MRCGNQLGTCTEERELRSTADTYFLLPIYPLMSPINRPLHVPGLRDRSRCGTMLVNQSPSGDEKAVGFSIGMRIVKTKNQHRGQQRDREKQS